MLEVTRQEDAVHARLMIVIATVLTGTTACCAHRYPSGPERRGYRVDGNEYRFDNGYRLVVERDDTGKPIKAQAFDADGKPVPTMIRPRRDLRLCVTKPEGWKSPECEPLSSMPYETYFTSGTKTTCYLDMGGYFIPYQC
jgi:hypothetical protein